MSINQVAEPISYNVPSGEAREVIELEVSGMSCGSCAARVQHTRGVQPGVEEALVNYATIAIEAGKHDEERLLAETRLQRGVWDFQITGTDSAGRHLGGSFALPIN